MTDRHRSAVLVDFLLHREQGAQTDGGDVVRILHIDDEIIESEAIVIKKKINEE